MLIYKIFTKGQVYINLWNLFSLLNDAMDGYKNTTAHKYQTILHTMTDKKSAMKYKKLFFPSVWKDIPVLFAATLG